MKAINDTDAWRSIPPEVKIEIMNRCHARGVIIAAVAIFLAASLSIGFQFIWLFWGSLLISPFIFQIATARMWRRLKPQTVLRYLAARSAARRYAFAAQANDLDLHLIMEGTLRRLYDQEAGDMFDSAELPDITPKSVWVILFGDVLVMLEERRGGARVAMITLLDDTLTMTAKNEGESEYTSQKTLHFHLALKNADQPLEYELTSRFPGALLVLEKKILTNQETQREIREKLKAPARLDNADDLLGDSLFY